MMKYKVLERATPFVMTFLLMSVFVSTSYAQTCVPGRIATGQYDPKGYVPSREELGEYGGDVDWDGDSDGDSDGDGDNDGGGGGDGSTIESPSYDGCTKVWTSDISNFCNHNSPAKMVGTTASMRTDRISCGKGPDGTDVMVVSEFADSLVSLHNLSKKTSAFGTADKASVSMEYFLPTDFAFNTGGRLPLGLSVGGGGQGGAVASKQNGSTVRVGYKSSDGHNMLLCIYSYHIDRKTSAVVQSCGLCPVPELSQWGESKCMDTPIPKGQWVTMRMGMTLGSGGMRNDSSTLEVFDSAGDLVDSVSFLNVTYRTNPAWNFTAMNGDDKRTAVKKGPKDQEYYIRNYGGYTCN